MKKFAVLVALVFVLVWKVVPDDFNSSSLLFAFMGLIASILVIDFIVSAVVNHPASEGNKS